MSSSKAQNMERVKIQNPFVEAQTAGRNPRNLTTNGMDAEKMMLWKGHVN